jgi:aminopeptidase N
LEIRNFSKTEIKGFTDVEIVAKKAPLSSINLDFLALMVDSIRKGNYTVDFFHQGKQLKIELPFLSVGDTQTIRVFYHGKPVKDPSWGGFFFSEDYAYNMGVGMASYPHSYGRIWFPCIDEFTDKSTYTFNILTDADKKAICGGMLKNSVNMDTTILWRWELTDPIPTYLASVAVGKYKAYKDTFHSVLGEILPIEIYADSITMLKVPGSFVNLKTFIHTFENRWGACRWQRVGYVVVPFNSGAMEHATSIAYPRYAVDGTTAKQNLISHELAHFWFGNLITCSNSHNMWINEGFATYGALLCDEVLDIPVYKARVRSMHSSALSRAHLDKFALDNVPINATYGTASYQKGGLVAYTLRHYMGDELYFSSIKQFLDENKYSNVTSAEFFQKLSQISYMDLTDFYLGWVHQPGFLNFNIDSVKLKDKSNNIYQIAFKQRLHYAEYFANNNTVDVEFVSASGERKLVERMQFSGESDIVEVELPFEPVFWAIDPNGKMGDACYDYTLLISKTGTTNWTDAFFRIQVDNISGESMLRMEYNPFAPTKAKNIHPDIFRISEKRFWRVGFLQYSNMQAQYLFSYNQTSDKELMQGYTKENLVLLYRRDAAHDWQIIPTTVTGANASGRLIANEILPGEYTLGIGNNLNIKELENIFEIFPNPTTGELRITNYELRVESIAIYDVLGCHVGTYSISHENERKTLDISHLATGAYFARIETEKEL